MPPIKHPHTFEYLEELARRTNYDPQRPLKDQLRAIVTLKDRGRTFREGGDLENAYISWGRAVTVINVHLPNHSQYNLLTAEQQHDLSDNGHLMFRSLQELKVPLQERYRTHQEGIANSPIQYPTGQRHGEKEQNLAARPQGVESITTLHPLTSIEDRTRKLPPPVSDFSILRSIAQQNERQMGADRENDDRRAWVPVLAMPTSNPPTEHHEISIASPPQYTPSTSYHGLQQKAAERSHREVAQSSIAMRAGLYRPQAEYDSHPAASLASVEPITETARIEPRRSTVTRISTSERQWPKNKGQSTVSHERVRSSDVQPAMRPRENQRLQDRSTSTLTTRHNDNEASPFKTEFNEYMRRGQLPRSLRVVFTLPPSSSDEHLPQRVLSTLPPPSSDEYSPQSSPSMHPVPLPARPRRVGPRRTRSLTLSTVASESALLPSPHMTTLPLPAAPQRTPSPIPSPVASESSPLSSPRAIALPVGARSRTAAEYSPQSSPSMLPLPLPARPRRVRPRRAGPPRPRPSISSVVASESAPPSSPNMITLPLRAPPAVLAEIHRRPLPETPPLAMRKSLPPSSPRTATIPLRLTPSRTRSPISPPVATQSPPQPSPSMTTPPLLARSLLGLFYQPQSRPDLPPPSIPPSVRSSVLPDVPGPGDARWPQHSPANVVLPVNPPPQTSQQPPDRSKSPFTYTSNSLPLERRNREADQHEGAEFKTRADAQERDRAPEQVEIVADASENSNDSEEISDSERDSEAIRSRISDLLLKMDIDPSRMGPPAWEGAAEMSYRVHSHLKSCTVGSDEYVESLKLLQDLCYLSGQLPSSYEFHNVTFDRNKVVGRGGEATVYHGEANGKNVVVREVVLSPTEWASQIGRKVIQLVHREAITHSQLHHPNIVAFLGIFHEAIGSPPIMVLPYIEKGSVSDLILNSAELITASHLARIMTGIGRGIAYLHMRNPPIVHGDIHPGNVLLDASYQPFLCDFGLSRISHEVTRTRTMLHEGGRTRFLAPELSAGLTDRFRTTQASDTFSLSMTFLNIWTRQHPFFEIRKEQKVAASLRRGQRPKRPTSVIKFTPDVEERFWGLLVDMWAHEPLNRPSSQTVRDKLESIFGPWLD